MLWFPACLKTNKKQMAHVKKCLKWVKFYAKWPQKWYDVHTPSHEKLLLSDKPEHIIIDSCLAIGIMKHSIIARWKVAYILNDWGPEQASFHQLAQRHSNRIPGRWKTDSEPFQRCHSSGCRTPLCPSNRPVDRIYRQTISQRGSPVCGQSRATRTGKDVGFRLDITSSLLTGVRGTH